MLDLGIIVQISVANVDRAKTDPNNSTVVVVEHVTHGKEVKYRLACAAGVIKNLYGRMCVTPVEHVTTKQVGLDECFQNWKQMGQCGSREAIKSISFFQRTGHASLLMQGRVRYKDMLLAEMWTLL